MKTYVLGFAFDQFGACALIEKQHPEWQKDKWNGIGGKIEAGETPHEAMAREFLEETGMETTPDMWFLAGTMGVPGQFHCSVFTTHVDQLTIMTATDEKVCVFTPLMLSLLDVAYPCISNIPAILALLAIHSDTRGKTPIFHLNYT